MTVPCLRSPIVLVHGLFGFNRVGLGRFGLEYFPGIPQALRAAGNRVHAPQLSPTAGIAARAGQLKSFLDRECPGEPVHLFGHSMGGLDARFMIACLGMAERVLSLTTIGTPHRGSAFADWGVRRFSAIYRPLFGIFNLPHDAFADLTMVRCRQFNDEVPDDSRVRYFSVAGDHRRPRFDWQWEFSARVLDQVEGPNDGIVSVASARYGEDCAVWPADHMNLANWPMSGGNGADRVADYAKLVGRLHEEGF